MVARTYANCLLTIALSNLGIFACFWPNFPRFFSLFSVTLLTIQEVTFNKINNLRGGGLQVKTGRWSRQRTENGLLKYEIASERQPDFDLTATVKQVRMHEQPDFCRQSGLPGLAACHVRNPGGNGTHEMSE